MACWPLGWLVPPHFDRGLHVWSSTLGTVGDASGISLGCRFVLCTDSVVAGFYRHAMLDLAYKTPVAVTKDVTDREGAIRGRQRCPPLRVLLCFGLFVLAQFLLDKNNHICAIYMCFSYLLGVLCFRICRIAFTLSSLYLEKRVP